MSIIWGNTVTIIAGQGTSNELQVVLSCENHDFLAQSANRRGQEDTLNEFGYWRIDDPQFLPQIVTNPLGKTIITGRDIKPTPQLLAINTQNLDGTTTRLLERAWSLWKATKQPWIIHDEFLSITEYGPRVRASVGTRFVEGVNPGDEWVFFPKYAIAPTQFTVTPWRQGTALGQGRYFVRIRGNEYFPVPTGDV